MNLIISRKKILFLEENSQFCRLLFENLSQLGYEVIIIHSLSDALNLLVTSYHRQERNIFDLMIFGEILIFQEKIELLNWIRSNGDRTPILVINPTHNEEEQQQYLELGANDYLSRPFTLRELLARCQDLLNDSSS